MLVLSMLVSFVTEYSFSVSSANSAFTYSNNWTTVVSNINWSDMLIMGLSWAVKYKIKVLEINRIFHYTVLFFSCSWITNTVFKDLSGSYLCSKWTRQGWKPGFKMQSENQSLWFCLAGLDLFIHSVRATVCERFSLHVVRLKKRGKR